MKSARNLLNSIVDFILKLISNTLNFFNSYNEMGQKKPQVAPHIISKLVRSY
jgi:hypothetical protein